VTDDAADSDALTPEEGFALFGHDLRVSILLELADAEGRSLPFTELRQRCGERDSGKFNYHLSKLTGRFVGHDDESDQYRLTFPGHWVVDAIQHGVIHERATVESASLPGECPHCDGPLRFDYDPQVAGQVRCRDCDRLLVGFPFNPGGLADRTDREVARAFDTRTRLTWRQAQRGTCPVCSGQVDTAFDDGDAPTFSTTHDLPVLVTLDCRQCSFLANVPPGAFLLDHPEIVSFLREHGTDLRNRRLWTLPFVVDPDAVAVESTDPWRVTVTVAAGETERVAVLDGSVSVTAVE
jgi:hypothetical protein